MRALNRNLGRCRTDLPQAHGEIPSTTQRLETSRASTLAPPLINSFPTVGHSMKRAPRPSRISLALCTFLLHVLATLDEDVQSRPMD